MKKDIPPEEKLLRLIKGSKKKSMTKEEEWALKAQSSESGMPQMYKMPGYRKEGELKKARSISISMPIILKKINMAMLNSILVFCLGALLLYFIYDLYHATYHKKDKLEISAAEEIKTPKIDKGEALEAKPYSFYSSSIGGRNIFLPQETEEELIITGPSLEEISGGFSLIGIIAGEKPQAIIEDRKSGKSYFLYESGVVGETKVVQILEDKVVMEYQGQRFELVL